jgi:hypothetical protein
VSKSVMLEIIAGLILGFLIGLGCRWLVSYYPSGLTENSQVLLHSFNHFRRDHN